MTDLYSVRDGFATLGPDLVHAMERLDNCFLAWARECKAEQMLFPPVIPAPDLALLDYFLNFPHLALLTAPLKSPVSADDPIVQDRSVPAGRLGDSEYALTSAACYSVYLEHRSIRLSGPRRVTTIAKCFRNEEHYDGLRRLRGFTMREIVCMGSREDVLDHLATFRPKVLEFARRLGLDLAVETASDPFFAKDGGRALMAKLFPVKEEFVHQESLAIGSLNFHRNFFGERCGITLEDGDPAFTGCVAFGLERWIAALLETHVSIADVVDRVTEATSWTTC
ncbi:MAG: aminoacyl--tRNA ligase-related protein [Streptosporangiaceae bacterium]|jgi:tRNA synthetase class II (G, H, P, S and T)